MLTAGVDLAAEPAGTAIALISWESSGARLREVIHPADDDAIVRAVAQADKTGIDCPLGWPDEFVAFVGAHRSGPAPGAEVVTDRAWRRRLAWRHTDEVVREQTGLIPLSVSADRIGHTAMRCAAVQAQLARADRPVDRSGRGPVAEVYPAASLKVWGMPWSGYKTPKNRVALGAIADHLGRLAPGLDLGVHEELCRRSDHVLDAVIAALTARAIALGHATQPSDPELAAARTEGWIAIPTAPLKALAPPGTGSYHRRS